MNIHNPYDQQALIEINKWKNPQSTLFNRAVKAIKAPINSTNDFILETPYLGEIIQEVINGLLSVNGLLSLCNKGANFSVRHNSIFREYREKGYAYINQHHHIHNLNLEDVDKVVGWLGGKYKTLAIAEGTATGAKGFAGLALDIPALIFLNLRAIGEYATYYGYDVSKQEETIFALNIIHLVASTDHEKDSITATLTNLSKQLASQEPWQILEKNELVSVIQNIAKPLGNKLTKAKLTQTIPIFGAAVGAGFNAYFTNKICNSAYYLYRERFLAEKYGVYIIQ